MTPAELGRHTLLALAIIAMAAWICGGLARRLGQPRVMGEIIGGIALGPSLLGEVWPSAEHYLFPAGVAGLLKPIADLGLVLFMFIVGIRLDREHLARQGHRAVVVSHTSIIVPFGCGALVAWWLHSTVAPKVDLLPFCLFVGAAMAVTAFPVLARILQETGLDQTRVGAMTLACAAVDDVTAWCVLAAVVAVAQGSGSGSVLVTVGAAAAFGVAMWWVVRPALARLTDVPLPVALGFALGCAWLTDAIGLHSIFGAFMAGVVLADRVQLRERLSAQIEPLTDALLLPAFFMIVGLSTQFGLLDSAKIWLVALVVLLVAMFGKLGGAGLAARAMGETWRDAATIGVLMNTRGLTEIVILTVGLQSEIINETMFTVMVLMALATTLMAAPVLRAMGVAQIRDRSSRSSRRPSHTSSA